MSDDATNLWDEIPDWGGIGARRLVRSPDAALGASLWELHPGGSQFVYHFHHGSEELLVVSRGEPTVRLHDGDRQLREGDVVSSAARDREGAIRSGMTATVSSAFSSSRNADPDVAEYPDTGKVGISTERGDWRFHRRSDGVEHAGPD